MKPKTDKELKELAKDMVADKIFTTAHVRQGDEHLIGSIFMTLLFMNQKQRDEMQGKGVAVLYEYMSEAGPREMNGYPIFSSMRTMSQEEWGKVWEYHEKIKKALDEV